jgi:hypothetical protein
MARSNVGASYKSLMYSSYKLNPDSTIRELFRTRQIPVLKIYTLAQLLLIIKKLIFKDKCSVNGPKSKVYVLTPELQAGLGVRSLHDNQLGLVILRQVTQVSRRVFNTVLRPLQSLKSASLYSYDYYPDLENRFFIRPELRAVLRTLPHFPVQKQLFFYPEVRRFVNHYLVKKVTALADPTNRQMVLLAGDPLGEVFGVEALHVAQLKDYIRSQLVPERWCTCKCFKE